ncbi:3,4-dihydroxy-2-butanone-4-phosphate synthase [Vibrio scophthalmi]|uniref:3,4-dihydroxy-2-butanone 4-phosphate synthase n=2 Tax=Vibrio scophthalmi TaxID=45658 RepID=F9RU31_9VIBR|nr:3,4-dihydroxy-2-butanone-4-phosphate synthase [Vibrio scophthalmi]ANU36497.1 3,4-dihydroxy-2-butanone-4-phosphate synthase [Vibrio scophthalmi]EGU30650.1 3,4-dihydroxy-2-butanone 4-phosphate synthase [Vibrio scophthalmi LMG 19158]
MNQTSLLAEFGNPITRVNKAIQALKNGQGVMLLDDEDRENEGDIIYSAEHLTPQQMALMIRECSGIVCLCLTEEHANQLELPPMVINNDSANQTAFTVSIEAKLGVTTGVSAQDRTTTVKTAIAANAKASDLARPGHVFPLRARDGGVLTRRGHTEGTIDLMKLADLQPAGLLCELTNPDGTMAKTPEIVTFAKAHGMPVLTIEDIVQYRSQNLKMSA